ncbi:coiled-coil domain-containing protein 33 [Rana temporaria]|uniref:coiled-coil domain-containing protein 33 n=1 Tax=Rana temporaria TaxID=8407 RepID=UPI001AADE5F8|nr:coiled-coil domain-containing protein 33 [Rana temporaria]
MPVPAARPAVPPGPPRLRLEDKLLSLEFRLLDAQFNEPGKYQLHLCVENPLLDNSVEGITVRVNHGDMIQSNQAETEIAEQEDLTDTLAFEKNVFFFVLPKGLCKNDKHHDVRLSIDVLKFGTGLLKSSKIVGQALFAIYPRTNQPRINLRAAPFEPLYNYQGVLALLRVGGDHSAMHCGRLAYNVCFREYQPPKPEEIPESASPIPPVIRTGNSHPGTPRTDQLQLSTHQNVTPRVPSHKSSISKPETNRSIPMPTNTSTPRSHYNIPAISVDQESEEYESSDEEGSVSPQRGHSQKDQDEHEEKTHRTLPPSVVHPVTHRAPYDAPLLLPSPPKTPASFRKTHVSEKPPGQGDLILGADKENRLLPLPGMEKIVVTLHSARQIPLNSAGSVPSPFVSLKSSIDEETGTQAQSVSHVALTATNNPVWGETLTMTVKEEEAHQEDLILTVADNLSQELLLDYRLPVHMLQPFHPYHLCLVQPHEQGAGECHLYVSIERRSSSIAQQSGFTYSALQVLLVGIESPLQGHSHPLLAVARIVPNYKDYSQTHKPPGMSGVPHVTATFPDPSPSSFLVPQRATQGHPQISSPGLPPSQPIWNSSYLFQGRDGVTLFSEGAALVLEYYPVTSESRRVPWHLSHYCGFSVIPLDTEIYHKLMTGNSNNALTLTSVPIQGTELKTASGGTPTVSLQLLLLKSEHPEVFLSPSEVQSSIEQHPTNNTHETLKNASRGELQKDGPSFPSYNALADILPDPWIQQTPREQKPANTARLPELPNTSFPQQHLSNNVELPADPVMEHQEQELANYRLAMQRMADDIITLRRQMSGLEAENSTLRSERSLNEDLGRTLLSDTDIDVMTKAELADRLVTLKQKLASETSELRGMRDRVQQLQNELVRRNDREKELLLLQRAHQQQQTVLNQYHQRLGRAKNLQDTVRKQEKVIEKMEKLLDNKLRDEKKSRIDKGDRGVRVDTLQGEVYSTLLAENARLREELDNARQPTTVFTQILPVPEQLTDSEKFSLLSKLEKSQARVQSLERELEESARRWGRDKQQHLTQISEQQMGFSRTQTTILHHFPTKDQDPPTKRHVKLDPLI